jgi:hypothetical protein
LSTLKTFFPYLRDEYYSQINGISEFQEIWISLWDFLIEIKQCTQEDWRLCVSSNTDFLSRFSQEQEEKIKDFLKILAQNS